MDSQDTTYPETSSRPQTDTEKSKNSNTPGQKGLSPNTKVSSHTGNDSAESGLRISVLENEASASLGSLGEIGAGGAKLTDLVDQENQGNGLELTTDSQDRQTPSAEPAYESVGQSGQGVATENVNQHETVGQDSALAQTSDKPDPSKILNLAPNQNDYVVHVAPSNKVVLKAREFVIGEGNGRARTPAFDKGSLQAFRNDEIEDEEVSLLEYAQRHKHFDAEQRTQTIKLRQKRGIQVPFMLDGVLLMNKANVSDPLDAFVVDVTNMALRFVVPEELALFTNIHTLRAGENVLPFAKLGSLTNLRKLSLPFNEISDLDLEVEGLFLLLEQLDLSYNCISQAAIIVLSTLPKLKLLDLTANKIAHLPIEFVTGMSKWQEKVIERLLPKHVALLDATLREEFGEDPQHAQQVSATVSDDVWTILPKPSDIIAFESLEQLILERNNLCSEASFRILGRLPSLRKLNLNHNHFKSLQFLSKHQSNSSPSAGNSSQLPPPPFLLQKYNGFPVLQELKIAFNKIDTLDGLVAVLWLPALRIVYIEGNPVLAHNMKDSYDPVKLLPRVYNIQIQDLVYQPHPAVLEDTFYALSGVKPTGGLPSLRRIIRHQQKASLRADSAALANPLVPTVTAPPPLAKAIVHQVQEIPFGPTTDEALLEPKRHSFKLTDAEVNETIRARRVLTLKELKRLRKKQNQERRAFETRKNMEEKKMVQEELERIEMLKNEVKKSDKPETTLDTGVDGSNQVVTDSQRQHVSFENRQAETSDITYDPNVRDATFITGVHIIEGDSTDGVGIATGQGSEEERKPEVQTPEPILSHVEPEHEEAMSESLLSTESSSLIDSPATPTFIPRPSFLSRRATEAAVRAAERRRHLALHHRNHTLPHSIQGSIRALRHAISNPVSYWRMVEDSYAKPTFAHTVRVNDAMMERKAKQYDTSSNIQTQHELWQSSDGTHNEYDELMEEMVNENARKQRNGQPQMSPPRSDTSSREAANQVPETGNVSPTNTMWTIAAVKFNADREAEIAAATRAAKNMHATAKMAGDAKAAKAITAATSNIKMQIPREKGVFQDEDALFLAQKLSKEQLRHRILMMNESFDSAMDPTRSINQQNGSDNTTNETGQRGLATRQDTEQSKPLKPYISPTLQRLEKERYAVSLPHDGLEQDQQTPGTSKPKFSLSALQRVAMKTPANARLLARARVLQYKQKVTKEHTNGPHSVANMVGSQKDEFDEMKELMGMMDSKIATIEANLATVLKSDLLQKHVPRSRKLIDEVQAEYKRLEKMYHESAVAAIEKSKVNMEHKLLTKKMITQHPRQLAKELARTLTHTLEYSQGTSSDLSDLVDALEHLFYPNVQKDIRQMLEWISHAFSENPTGFPVNGSGSLHKRFDVLREDEAEAASLLSDEEISNASKPGEELLMDTLVESDDDIQFEIDQLEEEIREFEEYDQLIERNHTQLVETKGIIIRQIEDCLSQESQVTTDFEQLVICMDNLSLKVDATMNELSQTLEDASGLAGKEQHLNAKSESCIVSENQAFLAHCDRGLADFIAIDEILSEHILKSYERAFDRTSDVVKFTRDELNEELNRLVDVQIMTERQYLNALLAVKLIETKLDALRNTDITVHMPRNVVATTSLLEKKNRAMQDIVLEIIENELPELWVDSTNHAVKIPILKADYSSKMDRCKLKLERLEKFAETLLLQQSRHQFLCIAFETELTLVKRFAHLIESASEELEAKKTDVEKQMEWYSKPSLASDAPQNRLIDSRNPIMREIMQILNLPVHDEGFVTLVPIENITEKAQVLVKDVKETEEGWKESNRTLDTCSNDLLRSLNHLHSMLYKYTSTAKVLHAPKELYDVLLNLRDTANELQPVLRNAAKDYDGMEQLISNFV